MNRILCFDTIDSTNNFLLKNLHLFSDFDFILAKYQTKGKGAGKNIWQSQYNKNILMSFVFTPEFDPSKQFLLYQLSALAISDFLDFHNIENKIKWPNDIFVEKNKIAGILIENRISGNKLTSVIGIGLNINQTIFELANATSLKLIKNKDFDIFSQFLKLRSFICKKFQLKDVALIKKLYIKKLYGFGKKIKLKDNSKIFTAEIIDIDNLGRLLVSTSEGIKKYATKEVIFVNDD